MVAARLTHIEMAPTRLAADGWRRNLVNVVIHVRFQGVRQLAWADRAAAAIRAPGTRLRDVDGIGEGGTVVEGEGH